MKLSDLREFVLRNRKKIVVVTILFIFFCIASAVGYRELLAPPSVSEEEKLPSFNLTSGTASITGNVSLSSLPTADFPKKITAYQIELLAFSFTEEEVAKLATRFGLGGEPRESALPNGEGKRLTFVNPQTGETLMVVTKPRMLTYVIEGEGRKGTLYDRETAITKATGFMEGKGLPVSQLSPFGGRYLKSEGNIYFETEEPTEAEFLEISFVWLVEGRDLLGEGPTDTAGRVIFDGRGKIISLKFRFLDLQFTRFGEVKLLTFSESITKLKKEGLVVSTSAIGTTTGWETIADLRSFAPEKVRLIYVQPAEATFLYPVYLFEGKGQTTTGVEVKAAVYLLAISPEYLKSKE